MSGGPDDRRESETLRPPSPGTEEQVSIPDASGSRRRSSRPPARASSAPPPRRSSAPPPPLSSIPPPALLPNARPPVGRGSRDPRRDTSRPIRTEIARSPLDAMASSLPEPPPPDRQQRIEQVVRELMRAGPETDAPLKRRLLSFGADALPALVKVFPGTIWVDLSRPHRPLKSARQLSAVAGAMLSFGDAGVPYLGQLLRSHRPESRYAAALVAVDVVHGDLVRPLAARLHDQYPLVRNAAMRALRASALLPEMRVLRAELVATLQDEEKPADWRRKAAWTLGQLRDAEVVPQLVEQLGASADVAEAAREALVTLVGRDLGRFRFRWRGWWSKHHQEPRVRWLIDALDQSDDALRVRAFDELVILTGEGFDRRQSAKKRAHADELAAFFEATLAGR